jgi:hypothetical protein
MTARRKIIRIILILLIAYLAQRVWMSEMNMFVWKLTYIGVHVAYFVHPPDYDSAASTQIFQSIAIIVNALVYAAVLWPLHIWLDRWKLRRKARKAAAS